VSRVSQSLQTWEHRCSPGPLIETARLAPESSSLPLQLDVLRAGRVAPLEGIPRRRWASVRLRLLLSPWKVGLFLLMPRGPQPEAIPLIRLMLRVLSVECPHRSVPVEAGVLVHPMSPSRRCCSQKARKMSPWMVMIGSQSGPIPPLRGVAPQWCARRPGWPSVRVLPYWVPRALMCRGWRTRKSRLSLGEQLARGPAEPASWAGPQTVPSSRVRHLPCWTLLRRLL
jgi:hypothetical protein